MTKSEKSNKGLRLNNHEGRTKRAQSDVYNTGSKISNKTSNYISYKITTRQKTDFV